MLGLALVVGLAFSGTGALAQGFMVKPMRMEVSAVAGRSINVPLEIRNTAGDAAREIELRLVGLSQSEDGGWRLVEPGSDTDTLKGYSSLAWTRLLADRISIAPLQPANVVVALDVPADARGVYFAGIVAETPLPSNSDGVAVRVRFLIPLIVQITGRPVRQQVVLADATMSFAEAAQRDALGTAGVLVVTNEGRTFSRVTGRLAIERKTGELWRPVTRFDISERSIIPGATLRLGKDLGRKVPSGTYRLRGELTVDGRRVPPLVKEIEFIGDPTADAIVYDTALVLDPGEITMEVVPGATRTKSLTIENPGTDPVQVSLASTTPASLGGVELGTLRGIDLSAEPWTQITPATFTLRAGGRQTVRVIGQLPREGAQFPNYYADLLVQGRYADGQSAGETRSIVHLENLGLQSVPEGMIEQLTLSEGATSTQYVVQARITNIGNVHLSPKARAVLLSPQGVQLRNIEMAGNEGMLLPLGKRNYSAELDVGGIEPGYYALRAIFSVGGGRDLVRQLALQVEQQSTGPLVTVEPEDTAFPGAEAAPLDPVSLAAPDVEQ